MLASYIYIFFTILLFLFILSDRELALIDISNRTVTVTIDEKRNLTQQTINDRQWTFVIRCCYHERVQIANCTQLFSRRHILLHNFMHYLNTKLGDCAIKICSVWGSFIDFDSKEASKFLWMFLHVYHRCRRE